MVDEITSHTNLVPTGCQVINADGCVVPNPLFSGVDYPDKLEAFYHQHQGPKGKREFSVWLSSGTDTGRHRSIGCFTGHSAAQDIRGSWALVHDKFRNITVCRNLLYMGYSFYYNSADRSWAGFYHGDGLKNRDLIFML